MNKLFLSVALLAPATFALAQTTAPSATTKPVAEDPNKVIIEAGDQKVTVRDFNNLVDSLPAHVQAMARGPGKRMLADKLIEVKLMAAEAEKQGLEKDPKVQTQLELAREQTLSQAMADKVLKGGDETALKQQYEARKGDYEQTRARHILIRSKSSPIPPTPGKAELTDEQAKAKAEDLRKRIVDKKEDFGAVAKAESDDPGSGPQGGELGFFGKGQMVPEFEKAAAALKPGEVSEPVKSRYGYHLIQLEDRKTPSFEEVKDALQGEQGSKKVDQFVKELKAKNPVTMDESFFGPPVTRPAIDGAAGAGAQ